MAEQSKEFGALTGHRPAGGGPIGDEDYRSAVGPDEAAPLVSVLIPAFNSANFLPATLLAALAQDFVAFEIVVVDDGSDDRTPEILAEFAAKDPRVRVLRQENAGVAAARNRAIVEARGRYIAPLDADDLWHPSYLRRMVDSLERAGPRAALAYAWSVPVDRSGAFKVAELAKAGRPRFSKSTETVPALLDFNFIGNASSVVMRRDAALVAGGYDPSLRARGGEGHEDWKLYTLIATRYDFVVVPEILVGYRSHPEAMSRREDKMLRSRLVAYEDILHAHPDLPREWLRASERTSVRIAIGTTLRCLGRGKMRAAAATLDGLFDLRWRLPFLSMRLGRPSDLLVAFRLIPRRLIEPLVRELRDRLGGPSERAPFSTLARSRGPHRAADPADAAGIPQRR